MQVCEGEREGKEFRERHDSQEDVKSAERRKADTELPTQIKNVCEREKGFPIQCKNFFLCHAVMIYRNVHKHGAPFFGKA